MGSPAEVGVGASFIDLLGDLFVVIGRANEDEHGQLWEVSGPSGIVKMYEKALELHLHP